MEIWLEVSRNRNYEVSSLGRVRSIDRTVLKKLGSTGNIKGKLLTPQIGTNGYPSVRLKSGSSMVSVHRLVAEAFLLNPHNKRTVNHKNGIRSDNRLSNLEWATYSENSTHAMRVNNHSCQVPVIQMSKDGAFIAEYSNQSEASRATGVFPNSISLVCRGKQKTAGGFIWKLKN